MEWQEVVEAAQELGWFTYLGTADEVGTPHVSVVSPGFTDRTVWFATRRETRKLRNIAANRAVAMHWSVGGGGPGELFLNGTASVRDHPEERRRLWTEANLPYDPSGFFQSPDNPDLVFCEVMPERATLLAPDFTRRVWRR